MPKIYHLTLISLAMLIGGCATEEFSTVKNKCESEALRDYPPSLSQEMVTVPRFNKVPSGNISCSSRPFLGSVETNCTQGTKNETSFDTFVQTVDTNVSNRNAYIKSCTRRQCLYEYGNDDCNPSSRINGDHPKPRALICQVDADCGSGKTCRSRSGGGTICRQTD